MGEKIVLCGVYNIKPISKMCDFVVDYKRPEHKKGYGKYLSSELHETCDCLKT